MSMKWIEQTGLTLIYPIGDKAELEGLWERWKAMSDSDKATSDQKSIEIFGMDNQSHYDILCLLYV